MSGTSSTAPAYPPPHGYAPASSQPFAPSASAAATSPHSSSEHFPNDYGTTIDPALEASGNAQGRDGLPDAQRGPENASDHDGEVPSQQFLLARSVSEAAVIIVCFTETTLTSFFSDEE